MARKKLGAGQTALVTGASTGIGVDLADCLARDGYDLILAARSEAGLQAVADRLSKSYDVKAHIFPVDLMQQGHDAAVDIVRSLVAGDYGIDAAGLFLK